MTIQVDVCMCRVGGARACESAAVGGCRRLRLQAKSLPVHPMLTIIQIFVTGAPLQVVSPRGI